MARSCRNKSLFKVARGLDLQQFLSIPYIIHIWGSFPLVKCKWNVAGVMGKSAAHSLLLGVLS